MLNGHKVTSLLREMDAMRREFGSIRAEWEDELSEMRNMWDKLQLWAARQAKRDKAITNETVDKLAEVKAQAAMPLFPNQMSKDELRRFAARQKAGVSPIRSKAE